MYSSIDHTFVVSAYGESPYLSECVASLLAQSLRTRVLITTSTPNPHIKEVADKFNIEVIENGGEPSIAHDWNCALAHGGTPLVTIAHQDDTYEPKYTERVLSYCNKASQPLLLFTDYGEIRGSALVDDTRMLRVKRIMLAPLKNQRRWKSIPLRRRMMSLGSPICCPSVTYCLPNLPKPVFRNGMRGGLDWDAWERISNLEGDFIYAPEVLMHHRIHQDSETSALIRDDVRSAEDLEMFRRFWPSPIALILNRLYGFSQKSNAL